MRLESASNVVLHWCQQPVALDELERLVIPKVPLVEGSRAANVTERFANRLEDASCLRNRAYLLFVEKQFDI